MLVGGLRDRCVLVAAVVVVVLASVTACSSSTKPSSSPGTTGATGTTSAATGSTIRLGDIADETGACLPGPEPAQGAALKAWESYVNAHGGVDGHPVQVTVIDTQCNPAVAATAAQTLISDHVLAIIDGTGIDSAFQKALDAAKIPVLCGIQAGNGFTCQSDANFFPAGTTVLAVIYGYMYATKQAGGTTYGLVYCSEVPACKESVPVVQGFGKELDMTVVNPVAASLSAADYTAQCLVMQQQHATGIEPAGPPLEKFANDCARQNYHPIYSVGSGSWQTDYLQDPNVNGTTGEVGDIPWFYQGPQTATFNAVEGQVLASTNYPYNVLATYAAALLFQTALAHAGANPTTTDLYNGLYAMHGETLGGFAPSLTFTPGKPTTVSCFFVVSIKNAKFVAPQGANQTCQPPSSSS